MTLTWLFAADSTRSTCSFAETQGTGRRSVEAIGGSLAHFPETVTDKRT